MVVVVVLSRVVIRSSSQQKWSAAVGSSEGGVWHPKWRTPKNENHDDIDDGYDARTQQNKSYAAKQVVRSKTSRTQQNKAYAAKQVVRSKTSRT